MTGTKCKQDYTRIASFMFLEEYGHRYGREVSGVLFNKFLTLLNVGLKEQQGFDMKLAHCWYRWGDVVVGQVLPYINWTHSDLNMTSVSFIGDPPSYREDRVTDFIGAFIETFISRYGEGKEGVEMAIDEVYSNAPLDFQRDYRMLRESLKISKVNMPYSNRREYIGSLFDKAMSSFPDAKFKQITKHKNDFAAVFREVLANGASNEDLFDIAEDFWFFFCYHLRVKYNENVRRDIVDQWREKLPLETSRYEASIQNYAHQFCPDSSNPAVQKLLRERETRLEELDGLLDGLEWRRCPATRSWCWTPTYCATRISSIGPNPNTTARCAPLSSPTWSSSGRCSTTAVRITWTRSSRRPT